MKIIKTDTTWSGRITLNDEVQIAPGVTLTIAPGTIVNGQQHGISVGGTLDVQGTDASRAQLNDVHIGVLDFETQIIKVDHAYLNRGSLLAPTGSGGHASLVLTDSIIHDANSYMYIWYPDNAGGVTISGNLFVDSPGLSVGTYDQPVSITGNSFTGWDRSSAIEVWANYKNPLIVTGNAFYVPGGGHYALESGSGYDSASFTATGNYFGGLRAGKGTLDANDDLNRGVVDVSGALPSAPAGLPIVGGSKNDRLIGTAASDVVTGGKGSDLIKGKDGADWLMGGAGNDTLDGGKGADVLLAQEGKNALIGGDGRDLFLFSMQQAGNDDVVRDFQHGRDRLMITDTDRFDEYRSPRFVSAEGLDFGGREGELRWEQTKSNGKWTTTVALDVNGDKDADLIIELTGKIKLTALDFIV